MEIENNINKFYYKFSEGGIKKRNFELWKIINDIDINISFKEKFYLHENNLIIVPKCYCGGSVKFIDMLSGYRRFCSKRCMYDSIDIKNDKIRTSLKKWGVNNPSKSSIIKEKVKSTNLEKFGVEYPLQSNDIKDKLKLKFVERWGVDNPSKVKDIRKKASKTMMERWGVEHAMMSKDIKDKLKLKFVERWGVDNPSKVKDIRKKASKTMMERWGVEHALQNEKFLNKLKKTNKERWGFEYASQSEIIKSKISNSSLKRWGVDNPSKSTIIKEKVKSNNLKKWGVDNPSKLEEIKDKIRETNKERYKTDHISKSEEYRIFKYNISKDENYIKYLENGISLFKCGDHEFKIDIDNYIVRKNKNIPICTVCNPIGDNISISENTLFEYIKSIYKGEIIQSYRDGLEIDIYLPELGIGFEFNGLYWHSELFKDKWHHINKTNFFKEKGIRIIHIWEDDWLYKNEITKSQIGNWIKKNNKIWARKCEVKEINRKDAISFIEDNHIQGFINSVVYLGLFHNNEIISIMTFDHFEGRKKMEDGGWNLSRFCNKLYNNVNGSASKLLNYFIKIYNPSRIISYSDKNWSTGNLYRKIGFTELKNTNPDYKYIINGKRVHKSRFRKSRLNTNLTESEQMKKSQIHRIWDCGKIKFQLIF